MMISDMNIKKLGFGCMRFPKKGDGFDMELIKKMVDRFMEAGFTYFDTAWAYPGSEKALKEALVDRYPREKFLLATKMAPWIGCKTKEEAYAQFDTSLKATGAGYFDFYLLHNLGNFRSEFFDRFDCWNFAQEKKKEGLVKHVGFSFHSTPEELEEILTAHPEMEFVQLQINYADWEAPEHRSRECYEIARKHGKPVVIMEPVKGGAAGHTAGIRGEDPEGSRSGSELRFLGASLRGESRGGLCGAVRHERHGTDGGQHLLHGGFQTAGRRRDGDYPEGAGNAPEHSYHPLHLLQLLREGMSHGHRDLRILCGAELLHAVSQHGDVPGTPGLAGGRSRKETCRRVHQVRCLRTGMSAAHPHP